MKELYEQLGISSRVYDFCHEIEESLKERFIQFDKTAEYNQMKVLLAMQKNKVSEECFGSSSGYGYNDHGRDTLEKVYADTFHTEAALVRPQIACGTHALAIALFGNLRPGDELLAPAGKPYDTLDEVIGIQENPSSLKSFNVKYEQIDLIDNEFDIEAIKRRVAKKDIKLIEIQRSRGYALRKSISLKKIENIIKIIKEIDNNVIVMVDNCYGEFVDKIEPLQLGADVIVGSLIKNLGGGIAPNGAYIAGKSYLVDLASQRLTAPGLGKEVGPTLGINKSILQGLFMAPSVVKSSLKTAVFASKMLEELGYKLDPRFNEERSDIVQTIEFQNKEKLIKYCQGIQMGSPIDSNSIPEPWDMPGYTDKVIMAAGAFTQGSSIELSCDAPIRPPYVAFMQGGLTYEYGKLGVLKAIQNIY